jgi:plastocyanin
MKKSLCTHAVAMSAVLAFSALAPTPGTLAATPESSPPGIEVGIDNFSYSPAAVTVKVGTQVTWTNHDDIPHTVVSRDNLFKSKTLDTEEKFSLYSHSTWHLLLFLFNSSQDDRSNRGPVAAEFS